MLRFVPTGAGSMPTGIWIYTDRGWKYADMGWMYTDRCLEVCRYGLDVY